MPITFPARRTCTAPDGSTDEPEQVTRRAQGDLLGPRSWCPSRSSALASRRGRGRRSGCHSLHDQGAGQPTDGHRGRGLGRAGRAVAGVRRRDGVGAGTEQRREPDGGPTAGQGHGRQRLAVEGQRDRARGGGGAAPHRHRGGEVLAVRRAGCGEDHLGRHLDLRTDQGVAPRGGPAVQRAAGGVGDVDRVVHRHLARGRRVDGEGRVAAGIDRRRPGDRATGAEPGVEVDAAAGVGQRGAVGAAQAGGQRRRRCRPGCR